jgi:hypothetical protein
LIVIVEIFFISIHSAMDDDGDPIHAISLKIIFRVVDDVGALAGKTHGAAGSVAGVDDAIKDNGEDEVAITLSLKLPSAAGACADAGCSFDTLFFTDVGACGPAATLASAAALSSSAGKDDDDALPAAKRSLSKMVSTPAVFIPSALLIAEG